MPQALVYVRSPIGLGTRCSAFDCGKPARCIIAECFLTLEPHGGWPARLKHLVAGVKVFARVGHQLTIAGVVHGFDTNHLGHNFKASSEAKGSVSQSENPYLIHKLT